jgi:hypothetical protein
MIGTKAWMATVERIYASELSSTAPSSLKLIDVIASKLANVYMRFRKRASCERAKEKKYLCKKTTEQKTTKKFMP